MIILEADQRSLTTAAKYTYLSTNYSSGLSTFNVLNATDSAFAADAFLLFGNFGAEDCEILKISSVNSTTGVIVTTAVSKFSHAESTRITVLPYNQVKFFHTTTTTFSTTVALTGYIDLQCSDWFTSYNDESYSTGYGWYIFYNSVTTISSQESNAIPYTGFLGNTTEQILSDFFSMIGNKELKLVTREDALSWASEGYSRMRNKLNLTNVEYTASAITSLAIVSGTIEYDLPTTFDHLISFISGVNASNPGVWGGTKLDIQFIPLREAYTYNGNGPRYYIRGFKIGILPTPSADATYHYIYLKKASRLTLNTDEVDLPNGGENTIKDWMLYRAYSKFQNPSMAKSSLEAFTAGLSEMVIASVIRDASLPSWGITRESNV